MFFCNTTPMIVKMKGRSLNGVPVDGNDQQGKWCWRDSPLLSHSERITLQTSHPFVPSVHPCFGSCPVSAGSECLTSDEAKIKGRRHILPVDQMRNSFIQTIWNFTDTKLNPGEGIKGGVWNGPNAYEGTADMHGDWKYCRLTVPELLLIRDNASRRLFYRCQF